MEIKGESTKETPEHVQYGLHAGTGGKKRAEEPTGDAVRPGRSAFWGIPYVEIGLLNDPVIDEKLKALRKIRAHGLLCECEECGPQGKREGAR